MKYFLFELICRKCGETLTMRMTQFDSLPNCPKCGNEMLAENVSPAISEDETIFDGPA